MVTKRLDETVRRRLRAGQMMRAGKTPAHAAQAVGVAGQTAYTWKALLDEKRLQALGLAPLDKPTEPGFGTDLWTLKRVGEHSERL